jgi:hypothetical protein
MFEEWLQRRVTVAQAEADHLVRDERLGLDPVPFGFQNARWQALQAQVMEGDELWEYSSPPWTWSNMAGRAGYALVRGGKVVGEICTRMN